MRHGQSRAVRVGILVALLLGGLQRSAALGAPGGAIDLNKATVEELAKLPGIGPAKAQAIAQHRVQHPFARTEDLRQVKGIGDKLYEQIKDQVTVGEAAAAPKGHGS